MYDRTTKAQTCAALGVRELWLIDETAQTVEVRRQAGGGFFGGGRTSGRDEPVGWFVLPTPRPHAGRLFTG